MLTVFDKATHRDRVELWFYVDSDDPELGLYKDLFTHPDDASKVDMVIGINVEMVIGPPISVSKSWNVLAEKCTGDILMMGNDDLLHETHGWDVALEDASNEYPDDIYCAYFNDGIWKTGQHCAFPAVSRKWYETLGYFTPGIFEFMCNDTWVFEIAKDIDRLHWIGDFKVLHNHFSVGGPRDATVQRHRSGKTAGRIGRDIALQKSPASVKTRKEHADLLRGQMR